MLSHDLICNIVEVGIVREGFHKLKKSYDLFYGKLRRLKSNHFVNHLQILFTHF